MRNVRVDVVKRKDNGTCRLVMYVSGYAMTSEELPNKEYAEKRRDEIRAHIDRIRMSKLNTVLTDQEIVNMAHITYPDLERGIMDDLLQDLLRRNFVKVAKLVRSKLLEINLNFENDKEDE